MKEAKAQMKVLAGNLKILAFLGGFFVFLLKLCIAFLKLSKKRREMESTDAASVQQADAEVSLLAMEDLGSAIRLILRVPEYLARGYDECTVTIAKETDPWVEVRTEDFGAKFNVETLKWKGGKSIFYGRAPQDFVNIVQTHWTISNGEIPSGRCARQVP